MHPKLQQLGYEDYEAIIYALQRTIDKTRAPLPRYEKSLELDTVLAKMKRNQQAHRRDPGLAGYLDNRVAELN